MKEIESELGKIVSINTAWSRDPRTVNFYDAVGRSVEKEGENFQCSVQLEKLMNPISRFWKSFTREEQSTFDRSPFFPAPISSEDLLEIAFKHLSPETLNRIANEGLYGFSVRSETDRSILDFAELAKKELESRSN